MGIFGPQFLLILVIIPKENVGLGTKDKRAADG